MYKIYLVHILGWLDMNIDLNQFFKSFRKDKVLDISELSNRLGISPTNTRGHLKKKKVITSYNKNGKFYVLPGIPKFNQYGIWTYKGICFSAFGNLKQTFIKIIINSDAGLGFNEIGEILHMQSRSFLSNFRDINEVRREKVSGKYVYFSSESVLYSRQKGACEKIENEKDTYKLAGEAEVAILAEKIKKPNIYSEELSRELKKKGFIYTKKSIDNFFTQYSFKSEFEVVVALRNRLNKLEASIKTQTLFSEAPTISFDPNQEDWCPEGLKAAKTFTKTVYTLHVGLIHARNKYIRKDGEVLGSKELLKLVAPNCNYGFDVIIHIGKMMFSEHSQASEIQYYLNDRNIPISESEVNHLSKKYIAYLSVIHEQSSNYIVEIMDSNGGYILHLDALGTNGGKRLISGIDSITDFVLGNAKISSENSDDIMPFLEKIKAQYGEPLRVVQDMGKGIMKAVKKVFPNVIILICHFHFLRDLGKDLMKDNYDVIVKRLTHFGFLVKLRKIKKDLKEMIDEDSDSIDVFHKIICEKENIIKSSKSFLVVMLYALLEWILDWKSESAGYGFPFDRPKYDLANRMSKAWNVLSDIPEITCKTNYDLKKCFSKITAIVGEVFRDEELQRAILNIDKEIIVFDQLRDAMRIAPKEGCDGLNDDNDNIEIETIETSVTAFLDEPEAKSHFSTESKMKKFFGQLTKYWNQLFADPITVGYESETKTIIPQRTNNIMERFFRDFSRADKRKTGNDNIGKTIQGMIADTPLVKNFENESYTKTVLGDKTLCEAFAKVDNELIKRKMKDLNTNEEQIPTKIKACLQIELLTEKMSNAAKKLKI